MTDGIHVCSQCVIASQPVSKTGEHCEVLRQDFFSNSSVLGLNWKKKKKKVLLSFCILIIRHRL